MDLDQDDAAGRRKHAEVAQSRDQDETVLERRIRRAAWVMCLPDDGNWLRDSVVGPLTAPHPVREVCGDVADAKGLAHSLISSVCIELLRAAPPEVSHRVETQLRGWLFDDRAALSSTAAPGATHAHHPAVSPGQGPEARQEQDKRDHAVQDLGHRMACAVAMLFARPIFGVDRMHATHWARVGIMHPVDPVKELHTEEQERPEIIAAAFLANACKELIALLPPEALLRLQTALQTDQFFASSHASPDDVHLFPQARSQILEQLAQMQGTEQARPSGQHRSGGK